MKLNGLAQSGGEAKFFITSGDVTVNGEVETRRGRKLRDGDVVEFSGQQTTVVFEDDSQP